MSASATQGGHNYCTNSLSQLNKYGTLNIHYPGTRRVVKNYPGSLLPGYPTGTRVPAAALLATPALRLYNTGCAKQTAGSAVAQGPFDVLRPLKSCPVNVGYVTINSTSVQNRRT